MAGNWRGTFANYRTMKQSDLPRGTKVFNNGGYKTYVVGADSAFFGDGYHYFLRAPWWVSLLMLVFGFIALNIAFAVAYSISGGIAAEGATTFLDGLFFSVQTMATIGYGVMHPTSMAANTIVIVESMVGNWPGVFEICSFHRTCAVFQIRCHLLVRRPTDVDVSGWQPTK
jgi:hypothetical protein